MRLEKLVELCYEATNFPNPPNWNTLNDEEKESYRKTVSCCIASDRSFSNYGGLSAYKIFIIASIVTAYFQTKGLTHGSILRTEMEGFSKELAERLSGMY